jgi:phage FluMu gp28-like protein
MDRAEQLKIFARCLGDPTFDLTQKGMVPFKLFYKQKEIIKSYEEHNRNLVTKPRQAGVSTTTAAYIAVKSAFGDPDNPHKVLILANKQTLAQEFLKKVKDFLDQIPYWVWGLDEGQDYLEINSKGHIKLKSNGCEIRALATSKDALRGFTPTFLVMDEAAFIDNGSEVFGAALASLGTGGKIALISTPNGMDPLYYKTYDKSKTGDNNFHIVEMKWYHDIRYNRGLYWTRGEDEKEEKIECETLNRTKLRWEYMDNIYETDESTIEYYEVMIKDGWKPLSPWYEEMAADMGDPKKIAQELDVSFIIYWFGRECCR